MSYSEDVMKLTNEVKGVALSSGAELVGIISTESIDTVPGHWVGWEVQEYTKRSTDFMDDPRSIVVLGYHAWDDVHEIAIHKGGKTEYPAYHRMRLFARRALRYLQSLDYKAVIYPYLLSQKKMAQLAGLGSFGKNSLIINPKYGPWFRLQSILTDAELVSDAPFEEDLCGDCEDCIEACPVDALTPYKVDPDKCLIGVYMSIRDDLKFQPILTEHMPRLTENSVLMCTTCQKVCPHGKKERGLI